MYGLKNRQSINILLCKKRKSDGDEQPADSLKVHLALAMSNPL